MVYLTLVEKKIRPTHEDIEESSILQKRPICKAKLRTSSKLLLSQMILFIYLATYKTLQTTPKNLIMAHVGSQNIP